MAAPRVLITGFGPFPGVTDNPSAWLAATLAKRARAREFTLETRVLPTEWEAITLMPRLYRELQPHVMIHFGVSERSASFRIERSAHNHVLRRADACGAIPQACKIHANGANRFDTAFPAAKLAAHLRKSGLPAITSRSAGSYLCNFLYYHSLDWAQRQETGPLVIFVHIPPWTKKRGPLSRETLIRGGNEILRFALGRASRKGQVP
jgi:pyroglutamyl-peptidase